MCILDHTQSILFFCLGKFLKKLADNQMLFHNLREYRMILSNMYIHPFTTVVD